MWEDGSICGKEILPNWTRGVQGIGNILPN